MRDSVETRTAILEKDIPEIKQIVKEISTNILKIQLDNSKLISRIESVESDVSHSADEIETLKTDIEKNTDFRKLINTVWKVFVFIFGGQSLAFFGLIVYFIRLVSNS